MTGMNERNRDKSTEKIIIYTRQHPRYTTSIFARAVGQPGMQEGRGNVSVGGSRWLIARSSFISASSNCERPAVSTIITL